MTKEQLLIEGGLDFTVSKQKMSFQDYDGTHETPFYCTVNNRTAEALGPVRSRYTVLQNKDLLDGILDRLKPDTYDLTRSTCGMFQGGKKVYFFIKLKSSIDIPFANDIMDLYLYALSSHDGSQRLVYGISTRMHSCHNMFSLLMADIHNNYTVKHTARIESGQAMEHMNGLIERNTHGLLNMFNAMHNVDYDDEFENKFINIVGKMGKRPDERTIKKRTDLVESISTEVATKGRNLYGLFNGLTHYITHKHKENTSWSSEYEQLVGNSNTYVKKALTMIGDRISQISPN
jgi:hypothetical protein